ncbi:MAG: DUF1993 domain-containing protein [Pseudomonadota bacterium]
MTVSEFLISTYQQFLQALSSWLQKASDQTEEADSLMAARLAPDMFPLSTQVRFACLQAHEGVYRIQHEPFPASLEVLLNEGRNGENEPGTIMDAQTRIREALEFLQCVQLDAVESRVEQPVTIELPMPLAFDLESGQQYARDWALPQFYFHIMAAYAILRHHGIDLGKADYVAHMFAYQRPAG